MNEVEPTLFSELKRNKFSCIPKFSEEDVASVWEGVSRFVERQMGNQKGVTIPGLGTFTFSQRTLDVGHGKQIVIQRPVFQLAEKFGQVHALNYTKHYVTGQIPILQLNFTAIASETPYPREAVESCVKEVLQALSRSLHVKRNVEFIFSGIGSLSMRDSRVKMKFYKDFIRSMDNSEELVNALRNRPDTSDSVLSDLLTPRPTTGNTVILPRININPDNGRHDNSNICESRNGRKSCASGVNIMTTIDEGKENQGFSSPLPLSSPPSSPKSTKAQERRSPGVKHQPISLEQENPNEAPQRPLSSSRGNRLRRLSQTSRSGSGSRPDKVPNNKEDPPPPSPNPEIPSPKANAVKNVTIACSRPDTGCSHNHKAGQELCYLCHQRRRQNIPVYLSEEARRKEKEEERLVQQYLHDRNMDAILSEQAKNFSNRKLNQETAAFNFGVAEAIKEKKNARSTDFNRSYLFRQRGLTPPYYLKQYEYSQDLAKQVDEKNSRFLQEKSHRDFLERLEQVQLAEELARQRDQYLQEKKCKKEQYREALNAQLHAVRNHPCRRSLLNRSIIGQMRLPKPNIIVPFEQVLISKLDRKLARNKTVQFKPLPIPAAEPDSKGLMFGIHDETPEKLKEKRDRARKLYHDQLAMVADKKRTAILRDLTAQREESDMLERTKREMLNDRTQHFREAIQTRRALEKSWAESCRRKQLREAEESARAQSPGMLIQEQCDKYHRCDQCGRRPWNCGESNIWRESRYIAGSRLIV